MNSETSPTQQAVILLALATSSLITVKDYDLIPELKTVVSLGVIRMMEIIQTYPTEKRENFDQTPVLMKRVSELINKPKSWFSVETVVFMGNRICTDLLAELCNPVKRSLIEEALMINNRLDDFLDPEGKNEETRVEVEEILKEVYKEIGFAQELRYIHHWRKLQRRLKRNGRANS